ncbi:MAG: efflux RND transporter permease subunit [candidate division Zixibacteria bacterium]|nr:efflux RND transporter permease subunit [candidate division Zixibacteria bacterium]
MKISDISIKRPVFCTMMIGALLVLGLFSYSDLAVEMMPEVDFPYIVVQTVYPGASAEAVETEVSEKVEEAANQISGVRHITSQSLEGYSLVVVEFELEVEGTVASQDMREKVAAIRGDLPEDIEEPIVSQFDPNAQPIMSLAVSGQRSPRDITQLAKDVIKPRLEPVPGVGGIQLIGGSEREIRVFLNPERMESYAVTIDEVRRSVMAANLEIPGGRIEEFSREYLIRTKGRLTRVAQFDSVIVKNENGTPIYLSDLATVVDTIAEQRSLSRYNGNPAIGMDIIRKSGANVVEMARRTRDAIIALQSELPPDIKIEIVNDNSVFIRDSIHEIVVNIQLGTILAVIVIFLFLLDPRPTIITGLSIPISIIATFTLVKFLGFSINFMTLVGLSLAVGILVDDAIVVIENIYRHLDKGKGPFKAAFDGTKEIGLAVSATTFSIMVVFLPVAFMEDIVGRFFYQFGMTVAFAVLISLFVAFTLTPMLSSRWLTKERSHASTHRGALGRLWYSIRGVLSIWNAAFDRLKPFYERILAFSLRTRWLIVMIAAGVFVMSLVLAGMLGSEFLPETDEGKMYIAINAPPGTDLDETSARFAVVEQIVNQLPQVIGAYVTIGGGNSPVNEGLILVQLTDASEREISAKQLMDSVRVLLADLPGVKTSVSKEGGDEHGKPIEISIRGDDLATLTELVHEVERIARNVPGATDIDNTMEEGKPEILVGVDRKLADDLGLNLQVISTTIRSLVEGDVVTRFKEGDEEYDVRIQLGEQFRGSVQDIGRIMIESNKEIPGIETFLVPLDRVASLTKGSDIGQYDRFDRQREVRVNGNVLAGYFAGTVTEQILIKAAKLDLPPGYEITAVGMHEIMERSFSNIFKALLLAIVFIYLVLASQYESFFDPLSIMVSLPLSLVGAVLGLLAFGTSLNIMSLIGIVMLMGLVTKNAILLIDFVKQHRARGVSRTDAILAAGPIRLRPILMTTFATVFGMLPLALGIGPGAEMRAGMARAVIGGIISSTVLTLIVVPVVYTIIDDIAGLFRHKEKEIPGAS